MDTVETKDIKDEEGNNIRYAVYRNNVFPPHVAGGIRDLVINSTQFQCREDDVLLYTYPKSGTHWLYNIIHMLRSNSLKYVGSPTYIEFHDIDIINCMPSPRLFATHLEVNLFPTAMINGTGKIINIIRNPKDVAVSYFCFLTKMKYIGYTGNFSGFLRYYLKDEFFFGGWFAALKQWMEIEKVHPNVKILTLYYEDLKRNTLSNLRRVAEFLQVSRDEEFLKQIEMNTRFTTMKTKHETEAKPSDSFKIFFESGIMPIYRKGDIADWKNWFTVAQNEEFDKIYNEKMKGYDIDLVYD